MKASQVIRGNHNVQIRDVAGSSIQITYYSQAPRLVPLEPAVVAVGAKVTAPARLLKARSGVIPYTAHRELLDDLETWCHTAGAFAACLIGGRGGAGKTRLGVELCSRVSGNDWLAGLLKAADEGGLEALVRVPTPRLVVIDYAETKVETIASLLPLLAAHASEEHPVRVLLLVRAAPRRGGDWTEALRDRGEGLDALADEMKTRAGAALRRRGWCPGGARVRLVHARVRRHTAGAGRRVLDRVPARHFGVVGKDGAELRSFYSDLFEWEGRLSVG